MTKRKRLKRLVRARAAKTGESYTAARRHITIRPLEVPMTSTEASSTGVIARCSFCTKTNLDVGKLVAGPGVYICDECIALCNDILDESADTAEVSARVRDARARRHDDPYAGWSTDQLLSLLPGVARTAREVLDDLDAHVRRLRRRDAGWDRIGGALGTSADDARARFPSVA
ncbi:MAG TPA: ClpX C4-type zinc finger protein [Acidimicrobiia bacterium]|jgi:hypothetical protein